jgi:hypothetical protein
MVNMGFYDQLLFNLYLDLIEVGTPLFRERKRITRKIID